VTFHETFWVVTGSTAPVVALAAIISAKEIAHDTGVITDPVGEMVAAHVTGPKMEQAHSYYQKWALVGYAQWLAQLVNVCLQALLLTVSLLSIAYQRNVFPIWIGVAVAVGGVALLAVTGVGILATRQLAAVQLASITGRVQMAVGPLDAGVRSEEPRPDLIHRRSGRAQYVRRHASSSDLRCMSHPAWVIISKRIVDMRALEISRRTGLIPSPPSAIYKLPHRYSFLQCPLFA